MTVDFSHCLRQVNEQNYIFFGHIFETASSCITITSLDNMAHEIHSMFYCALLLPFLSNWWDPLTYVFQGCASGTS